MNDLKNTKTHLDDLFAEARAQNVTPASELLKTGIPQNSFKSGFVKIGVAGLVAISAISFFFLKDDEAAKKPENLVKAQTEVVQNDVFKKEIPQEKPVVKLISQDSEGRKSQPFKKVIETKASVESEKPKIEFRELQQTPESIQLSAIPLVELRDFELKKLGIEVLKDGDIRLEHIAAVNTDGTIYTDMVYKISKDVQYQEQYTISTITREEYLKLQLPNFSPKRITNSAGTITLYSSSDENDYTNKPEIPSDLLDFFQYGSQRTMDSALKKRLQDYATQQIRFQDSVDKEKKYIPIKAGNFIAWFRTSEEVLKRLPDFTANTIRAELSGKDLIIQTEEFREEYPTSGFCYLDLCEKANGAIICAKVFPNPAQDKRAILNYELAEERNIITALYDLSGRKLREFSSLKTQQKGRHEEEISLAGIEKGIYLVAIITGQGEKLSRRIIID